MYKFKYWISFNLALLFFSFSYAQSEEQLVVQDFLLLADNFISPASKASVNQAGSGWFNTATTLTPWRLKISLHANALIVPKKERQFNVSNSQFNILEIQGAESATVPSAFGGSSSIRFRGAIESSLYKGDIEFEALEGLNRSNIIHAFPQVNLGLPFGFEMSGRFLPELEFGSTKIRTFGVGLKYNIIQLFKEYDWELNVAIAGAYTNFQINYGFDDVNIGIAQLNSANVEADIWMGKLLVSQTFKFIEPFAAFGVTNADFNYAMNGSGALEIINSPLGSLDNSENRIKADVGFNILFGDFYISSMATIDNFVNLNLGFHFKL